MCARRLWNRSSAPILFDVPASLAGVLRQLEVRARAPLRRNHAAFLKKHKELVSHTHLSLTDRHFSDTFRKIFTHFLALQHGLWLWLTSLLPSATVDATFTPNLVRETLLEVTPS